MSKNSLYWCAGILILISLGIFLWFHRNREINNANELSNSSALRTSPETNASHPQNGNDPETANWQTGLTPQQVIDGLRLRETQQGGPLQVWKNKLEAKKKEAETITNVKVTPEIGTFFDKVRGHLYEYEPMIDTKGAQISSVIEAKQATVVVAKFYGFSIPSKAALHNGVVYFAPQATAKLAPSRIHPKGSEIKVPDNFSKGWAIKLSERDRIILYKWDFNESPPEDGILGIETEFE